MFADTDHTTSRRLFTGYSLNAREEIVGQRWSMQGANWGRVREKVLLIMYYAYYKTYCRDFVYHEHS